MDLYVLILGLGAPAGVRLKNKKKLFHPNFQIPTYYKYKGDRFMRSLDTLKESTMKSNLSFSLF